MAASPENAIFVAAFAPGARLDAMERFVCTLPTLFPSELIGCDLAWRSGASVLAVVMSFHATRFGPKAQSRLEFWCARAGVRCSPLDQLSDPQRAAFLANLDKCEQRLSGVLPGALPAECVPFFTAAGAPPVRSLPDGRVVLAMDVGGPGWSGVRYDPAGCTLFLPGQLAPPRGDALTLALRFPGSDRPYESQARVGEVRSPDKARPGSGVVGFTLELLNPPPALLKELQVRDAPAQASDGSQLRIHQRYNIKAPVVVTPYVEPEPGAEAEVPADLLGDELAAAASPAKQIDFGSDGGDYVEDLSQGGAFVHTSSPSPVGTRLTLCMRLPTGDELTGPALVMAAKVNGMGVKFEFSPDAQQVLAAALAHIAARPRRALIVDDDELVRRMLQDAFKRRGFEVLTAPDGAAGLSIVVDELLALDLLVTDLRMPNMDGQSFIRTIRSAGGEADLAIVAVTSGVESNLEKRIEREGADAVLDKELGAELIAQAADAVLERKRMKRRK